MKILLTCKASTKIGFGHLIRSRTLAKQLQELSQDITLVLKVIGDPSLGKLLQEFTFPWEIIASEDDLLPVEHYDIVFTDMIEMKKYTMIRLKQHTDLMVSISPIFVQMHLTDLFFNRTKYYQFPNDQTPGKVFAGLEYALVQENCLKISAGVYEENLNARNFPIALSMGGGDAANKTLTFLKSLKKCQVPATFWVMLGEGYQHSYDALIHEIKKDSNHEIILAKTNRSMWQILKNCVLAVLPGGITTYEAAYAGLPTINLFEQEKQQFLVQELVERKACYNLGLINPKSLTEVNELIEHLYHHRSSLLTMHVHSKNLIDHRGGARILERCKQELSTMTTFSTHKTV